MNLTLEHCVAYLRSLHPRDTCGIRRNPYQTFISRVAKFVTGEGSGYAYLGGNRLDTPSGYAWLSPQLARIAQQFDDCQVDDVAAYDVDENGLTYGTYIHLVCGKWFNEYCQRDVLKTYSPDVYHRYYKTHRKKCSSRSSK